MIRFGYLLVREDRVKEQEESGWYTVGGWGLATQRLACGKRGSCCNCRVCGVTVGPSRPCFRSPGEKSGMETNLVVVGIDIDALQKHHPEGSVGVKTEDGHPRMEGSRTCRELQKAEDCGGD